MKGTKRPAVIARSGRFAALPELELPPRFSPAKARRMIARIPGWKIDSTYEEFLELARTLRGVAFRPNGN